MKYPIIVLATILAICATCLASAAAENPWVALTEADLRAVHDVIEAGHPGAVDPENPHFRDWLENGLKQGLADAKAVRSLDDYERVLRRYGNGFQDGHVGIWLNVNPDELRWTGFVVYAAAPDDARVVAAEPDSGVHAGDRLLSCDGKNIDQLLAERTDAQYWNAAIPHERYAWVQKLFSQSATDGQPRLGSCTFSSGTVALNWRTGDYAAVKAAIGAAMAPQKSLRLREIDGVWMISLPTFAYYSDAGRAQIADLIDKIKSLAAVLRNATVVIDVRGNTGGNSMWGDQVAAALWGEAWVHRIAAQSDGTVDWRVSAHSLARLDWFLQTLRQQGVQESSDPWKAATAVRNAIAAAMERHEVLVRLPGHPAQPSPVPPPDPLLGRVYLLTDRSCASACLDFADLVLHMPHVVQAGLPTNADSVYMDVDTQILPSGLATFAYPMKVYRHRLRKNNEWYEPKRRWPYGPMQDDAAIVRWIKTLD
jgi:hypothetical protein